MTQHAIKLAACFLILLFAAQAFGSLFHKSATVDEVLYIPAGYVYWKSGSFMLNPETPPLPRILCGIPLLFLNNINYDSKQPVAAFNDRYHWSSRFLFFQNVQVAGKMIFYSRVPTILMGMALLAAIYAWTSKLFGSLAGLFSLALAAFEPNLIAHSSLATTDLYTTAMIFFTVFSFWIWRQNPDQNKLLLFPGLFLGLALLSKSSVWLMLPVLFVLLWIPESAPPRPPFKNILRFGVILILALLIINIVFLFHGAFVDKGELITFMLREKAQKFWLLRIILFPFPRLYSFSMLWNLAQSMGGVHPFPFFLNGQYSNTGFWNYFLYAFLLKTPLPFLLSLAGALVVLFKMRQAWFVLLPPLFFLFYFSFLNRLDLGLRYVLPIYPFFLVAVGAIVPAIMKLPRGKILLGVLVLWSAVATGRIYPHHLAYFNELAGGSSNGYKHLVDSNLDWGQDLVELKSFLKKYGIDRIRLSYYGMSDPAYYGINYQYLPSPKFQPWTQRHRNEENFRLDKGLYAISATNVAGIFLNDRNTYEYFRKLEPIDSVGHSILIYEVK
jgi:4-amino-4-deoxy-L-arabinose transferase-like glycosyltransferase